VLATEPSISPTVMRADAVHVVGVCGATLIQIWRGAPNYMLSAEVNEVARAMVASSTHPVSSLFVVERGSPPPDEATRRNFASFSRDLVSQMSVSVVVAEGGGFRGALVRAVGVTLTTILPHSSKFRFVNDVDSAAELIAPYLLPAVGGAPGLLDATSKLRAMIGAPSPR